MTRTTERRGYSIPTIETMQNTILLEHLKSLGVIKRDLLCREILKESRIFFFNLFLKKRYNTRVSEKKGEKK